jgi:hypothetical protein
MEGLGFVLVLNWCFVWLSFERFGVPVPNMAQAGKVPILAGPNVCDGVLALDQLDDLWRGGGWHGRHHARWLPRRWARSDDCLHQVLLAGSGCFLLPADGGGVCDPPPMAQFSLAVQLSSHFSSHLWLVALVSLSVPNDDPCSAYLRVALWFGAQCVIAVPSPRPSEL